MHRDQATTNNKLNQDCKIETTINDDSCQKNILKKISKKSQQLVKVSGR